ncbi:MAG TPA: hypothetical protein VGL56_01245 [Fimbriimonadaceae bacterium]|jgi:hypothetical protein
MILSHIVFALLACTQTQSLAKTITFDEQAGTADHVLQDLSKPSGIQLKTSREMAKEVLLISVKDAPSAELLKRIATVTSGQWVEQDGELRLVADQGAREKERQAEIKEKAAAIRNGLTEMKAKLDPPVPKPGDKLASGDDEVAILALEGKGQSLAEYFVSQLDPDALAAMGKDDRMVFSDSPNSLQLRLPELAAGRMDDFIKEHNQMAQEMHKQMEQQSQQLPPGTQEIMDMMGTDSMFSSISGPPAKMILSIESPGSGMAMFGGNMESATLRFYDSNGKVIFTDQGEIPNAGESPTTMMQEAGIIPKEGAKIPPKASKKLELSPLSKEFQKLSIAGEMRSGGKAPIMTPELKGHMLHPETYDPLSYAPTDAFKEIAADKQEQLVADLPDSVSDGFAADDLTIEDCLTNMQNDVSIAHKDGWMQVTPKQHTSARFERLDRRALAILIAAAQAKGLASLDDLSAYAVSNEAPNLLRGVATTYMMLFVPGSIEMSMMGGNNDWKTLRLYGLMSPDQREALKNGTPMPYGSFSLDQKQIIQSMVYGSGCSLQETRPDAQKKKSPFGIEMFDQMLPFNFSQIADYLQEPTECLPQGLTAGVALQCAYSQTTAIKSADDGGINSMIGSMGADEYSLISYLETQPALQQSGAMPKFDKLKVGTRSIYDIRIQLGPNVYVKKKLIDDNFPLDAPVVTADSLPADFKSKVADNIEKIKKSPMAGMMKMPNMPVSPP